MPGGKKQLNNAGTNVPMIANWSGTIKGGQVVDDLVDFSDLLSWIWPGPLLRAVSLMELVLPSLRGKGTSPRTFTYCEEAVLPKPGGVEPDGTSSGLKWVRSGLETL